MPHDRGAPPTSPAPFPRGLPGGDGQRAAWTEPTAPAARRPPGRPRERRPALAALAVLLILGGALAAGFLVVRSGQRVAAIEISAPVGAGQRIPPGALAEVQIAAGTGLAYVPWDEASQVTRFYTVSAIPAGTLLTRAMVAATGTSVAGQAVLGLALKDGQLPRGLQDGDHVAIYQVSNAQQTCPVGSGGLLAADALVLAIGTPAAASGSQAQADVEVAVSPADAGPVACNAANGVAAVAVLPAGTTAAPSAAPGRGAGSPSPGRQAGSASPVPGGGTG
ncbi:MAG TPA: hypothetical protein VMH35_09510 [Streptosporangiaceae bacterium]|nr:hypothetical protein [Streptosporangiaceae bacterium]